MCVWEQRKDDEGNMVTARLAVMTGEFNRVTTSSVFLCGDTGAHIEKTLLRHTASAHQCRAAPALINSLAYFNRHVAVARRGGVILTSATVRMPVYCHVLPSFNR